MVSTTNPTFILIAEDDIDDQEMIDEMIRTLSPGCKLEFVDTGGKVINFLNNLEDQHLPDLILLDFNMPEFTGVQILQQIGNVKRYSTIPKLLWSTSKYSVLKNDCLQYGAEDFLVKPSSLEELNNTVRQILAYAAKPEQS